MSYEETLSALLLERFPVGASGRKMQKKSLIPLFAALGCPHVIYMRSKDWTDNNNFDMWLRVQQPAEHYPAAGAALMKILDATKKQALRFEEEISMLDGLVRDNHWKLCLENPSLRYAFVRSIIFFSEMIAMGEQIQFDGRWCLLTEVRPVVYGMLNAWLRPLEPYTAMPSAEELTRAMFGNAWCDLMLDAVRAGGVGDLIRSQKPPFLPGLVIAQAEAPSMTLPEIGMP
jgi:hypothetical protein